MDIIFQHIKATRNRLVEGLITEKLEKLARKYPWIIRAEVFLRKETAETLNKKVCEIRISIPGPTLFSSAKAPKFEQAAAEALNDMETQLQKKKEAMKAY